MKKKQIMAWLGIILLAGMYLVDLVLALIGSPAAKQLLMISLLCTAAVPILLYGIQIVTGKNQKKGDGGKEE
ncbi:hypothetical protein [Hominifimenecus sp. rT4P-3]|uniref:hypothetical protein n=1 Tax=Hominifimenecus sp. rT4P-3 TaxID=3242979 RepID=UPI003DA4FB93